MDQEWKKDVSQRTWSAALQLELFVSNANEVIQGDEGGSLSDSLNMCFEIIRNEGIEKLAVDKATTDMIWEKIKLVNDRMAHPKNTDKRVPLLTDLFDDS